VSSIPGAALDVAACSASISRNADDQALDADAATSVKLRLLG
jgi:hypothetical protein